MGRAMVDHHHVSFARCRAGLCLTSTTPSMLCMADGSFACSAPATTDTGFQPIVVFDGEGRMIAAVLRPACRPNGRQVVAWLRRLIMAIGPTGRGRRCCFAPAAITARPRCCASPAPTAALGRHVATLEASTLPRAAAAA